MKQSLILYNHFLLLWQLFQEMAKSSCISLLRQVINFIYPCNKNFRLLLSFSIKSPKITVRKLRFSIAKKQRPKKRDKLRCIKRPYLVLICGCADTEWDRQHWLFSKSSHLEKCTNNKINQTVTTTRKETTWTKLRNVPFYIKL